MALWYPQKFTHDEPPSSPTVTPGGRNTKYSEFAVGCGTAGSEAISSWTKRWISASSTLGGGAVVRAMAPLREPCVIAKSGVLYSASWSISGLASTKTKKSFSCCTSADCGACCQASPQKKRKASTDASSGPPRYVSCGLTTGAAASSRSGTIRMGCTAIPISSYGVSHAVLAKLANCAPWAPTRSFRRLPCASPAPSVRYRAIFIRNTGRAVMTPSLGQARWDVIPPGPHPAHMHMALDEVLLQQVMSGQRPPTMRLWRGDERAHVIGSHPIVIEEGDLSPAAGLRFVITRTLSGGGAVRSER